MPLLAILALQAALTIRLIWTNTAYQDEALYLWAGHLEIAHWFHGTPIPPFATYFSGAPVVYPPLGALFDSLGGLAAARLLSLAFMLGATCLLWCTTTRLYCRRAAFYAVALFVLLGPTLHIGAFATFDAPALFLIALSAWCVVRADKNGDGIGWLVAAAAAITLANVTAYSSTIFDPVLVAVALLTGPDLSAGKEAARRAVGLFGYITSLIVVLAAIGGAYYWTGIGQTVLARVAGATAPLRVLDAAVSWIGLLIVLAAAAAAVSWWNRSAGLSRLLPLALLAAALLAPVEQARIHTLISLDKHVDIGAWFAAIAAGYLIDAIVTWIRPRALRFAAAGAATAVLIIPARLATAQAATLYDWPNAAAFATTFSAYAGKSGPLLVENPSIGEYYLASGRQWQRWSNTRSIISRSGRGISGRVGAAGAAVQYARAIKAGYFATVALNFRSTPALDQLIAQDLNRNSAYHLVATIPYGAGDYTIWQRAIPRRRR